MTRPSPFRADMSAGCVSALLMLPQAVALATLAGMPPETGIYASIFPVIVASVLGASRVVLSGPNTAVALMVAAAVSPFATATSGDYLSLVWALTAMVGAWQILGSFCGLGRFLAALPPFVSQGLTLGVGCVIVSSQLPSSLSVLCVPEQPPWASLRCAVMGLDRANPVAVTVALAAIGIGLAVGRCRRQLLSPLVAALVGGSLVSMGLEYALGADAALERVGHMHLVWLPLSVPAALGQDLYVLRHLLTSALAIAVVGALQTVVIADSIAASGARAGASSREVLAQGVANLVAALTSGFAGSGSFNRTAAHVAAGARSRRAGVVSALVLLVIAFGAGGLLAQITTPAVAGTLMLIGWRLARTAMSAAQAMEPRSRWMTFAIALAVFMMGVESAVALALFLHIATVLHKEARRLPQ